MAQCVWTLALALSLPLLASGCGGMSAKGPYRAKSRATRQAHANSTKHATGASRLPENGSKDDDVDKRIAELVDALGLKSKLIHKTPRSSTL